MSDQTRGIIFVVIVIAVTFIWMHYFQPPIPPPQKSGAVAGQTAPGQTSSAGSTQPAGMQGSMQMAAGAAPAMAAKIPVAQAAAETNIVVESNLYRVELSNHGAVARSWQLKKYFDDQ